MESGGLSRVYGYYKAKAGIEKKGGLQVFGRHSAATLMTARGVPLYRTDSSAAQGRQKHAQIRPCGLDYCSAMV
jgi:hypothetical protein